jgi:hypothetical protein
VLAKQTVYKLTYTVGKRKARINKPALVVGNTKLGNYFYHARRIIEPSDISGGVYEPTAENEHARVFFCKIFQSVPPFFIKKVTVKFYNTMNREKFQYVMKGIFAESKQFMSKWASH